MLALVSLLCFAEDEGDDLMGPKPPPYDKHVSITVSPLHLILPVLEVTVEGRAMDRVGVAGIVGLGNTEGYVAAELGAQGIFYPVGSFDHGMQIGAEVLAVQLFGAGARGTGVAIGPFLGYKIAARFGLTFQTQLGVDLNLVHATVGATSASQSSVAPLFNLNVGWSF